MLLPLLRSRPGGVRCRAIARVPEPVTKTCCTSGALVHWRRGWDSNPRYGFPYTAFPVLPVKPLLHLSGSRVRAQASLVSRSGHAQLTRSRLQDSETYRLKEQIPDSTLKADSRFQTRRFRFRTPDSRLQTHLAERVGFEPTVPLRVQRFSRPPDSATLAPLRSYSCSRLLRKKDCTIDLQSLSRTPSSTIKR